MIKIENNLKNYPDNPICQVICQKDVIKELEQYGIKVGRHCHPDYYFESDMSKDELKPKTILFEKIDGAYVKSSNRARLNDPNCAALVKNYAYFDYNVNNLACIGYRPFTRFFTEDCIAIENKVTEEMSKKIMTGISFLHYLKLNTAAKSGDNRREKTIDVFFAGTTDYPFKSGPEEKSEPVGDLVTNHRKEALNIAREYCFKNKLNAKIAETRVMNHDKYLDTMARSKLTISPFGWGEACYRDYEALLNETEIIKPKGYRIRCNPDIYNSSCVNYCDPNWKDLPEKIEKVLNEFDKRARTREINKHIMQKWREPRAIAMIILNIIGRVENEN